MTARPPPSHGRRAGPNLPPGATVVSFPYVVTTASGLPALWAARAGFVLLSLNPFGGMMVSIPYAQAVLGASPWSAAAFGCPLSYVQVMVVDLLWSTLWQVEWWRRLLERKRTPRLERLAASPYAFWTILVGGAFMGPWLVMAVMRYANVPQRRIALPMLLNLAWNAAGIALVCTYAPQWLAK